MYYKHKQEQHGNNVFKNALQDGLIQLKLTKLTKSNIKPLVRIAKTGRK